MVSYTNKVNYEHYRLLYNYAPMEFMNEMTGLGFYTALPADKPAWQAMFFPFHLYTWIVGLVTFFAFFLFLGAIYPENNFYIKVLSWQMLTLTKNGKLSKIIKISKISSIS